MSSLINVSKERMLSLLGGQQLFDNLSESEKIIATLSLEDLVSIYPFLNNVSWCRYKMNSKHHAKMNKECIKAGTSVFGYASLIGKLSDGTNFYLFIFLVVIL